MNKTRLIEIHPQAPPKPEYTQPCNGCGVCCAAQPCPVAYMLLWQFRGSCRALLWQDDVSRYVCGLVVYPDRYVNLIPASLRDWMGGLLAKRIAAGNGCDYDAEVDDVSEG